MRTFSIGAASLAILGLLFVASQAQAQEKQSPMRFLSAVKPVELQTDGKSVRYYMVTPMRPVKLQVNQPMTLLVAARPLAASGKTAFRVALGGEVKATKTLQVEAAQVATLTNGIKVGGQQVTALEVTQVPATVSVQSKGPIVVRFGSRKSSTSTPPLTNEPPDTAGTSTTDPPGGSTAADAPGDDAPEPPDTNLEGGVPVMPLIRRRVERLSLGIKSMAVVPTGPVDPIYGEGLTNVYFGAEIRYSMPFAQRRFGVALEGGRYELLDREVVTATDPFGSSISEDVTVHSSIVPLMADFVFKQPFGGRKRAVFAAVGGGVAFLDQEEEVAFRPTTRSSQTQFGARGRLGFEQKIAGNFLVLETSYLHLLNASGEPFLGGAFAGLQYRFVF